MSNITNNQPSNMETNMDSNTSIVNIFNDYLENGGLPKVTSFKKHLDKLINDNIKSLCSSQGKGSTGGADWRRDQKAKFAGRGAKWVSLSIDEISGTLDRLDDLEIDTSSYRSWIQSAGYAWIRYAGPRIWDGQKMAAFEVRTVGSTFDCPKSLHYILDSEVEETIKPLNSTPHAMKLEVKSEVPSEPVEVKEDEVEQVNDEGQSEVIEEEIIVEEEEELQPPTSDDPEEWEAYLAAQGLASDVMDYDDDFEQLNDDIF